MLYFYYGSFYKIFPTFLKLHQSVVAINLINKTTKHKKKHKRAQTWGHMFGNKFRKNFMRGWVGPGNFCKSINKYNCTCGHHKFVTFLLLFLWMPSHTHSIITWTQFSQPEIRRHWRPLSTSSWTLRTGEVRGRATLTEHKGNTQHRVASKRHKSVKSLPALLGRSAMHEGKAQICPI